MTANQSFVAAMVTLIVWAFALQGVGHLIGWLEKRREKQKP